MPDSEEPKLDTIRLGWPAEGVAVATLDRPERLNAMTMGMFAELEELAWYIGDSNTARVLILTGAGRAFCAGYDLADATELPELSPMDMLERQEQAARALSAIRAVRTPVIAAVNGAVAGGGLALALAADIRIASPAAKFNAAFVRIGLVNKVVPAQDLLAEAAAMASLICANSPAGVQLSKRALQANLEITSYAAALELENRGQALLTRGEDLPEALEAFRAKRPPTFTGR